MFRKAILVSGDGVADVLRDSFLAGEGFTLIAASSGDDPFRLVEEQDPALAILDLDRPEGVDCRRRLQEDSLLRRTPLLLLASDFQVTASPAEAVVTKPFDKKCLVDAACRLLGIDRRADPRPAVSLAARIGRPGQKLHPGHVRNLSSGGAFVEATKYYPVGTDVLLEILFPGDATVLCRARIAWVNHPEWVKKPALPAGMGVRFADLAERERNAVESLLARLHEGPL